MKCCGQWYSWGLVLLLWSGFATMVWGQELFSEGGGEEVTVEGAEQVVRTGEGVPSLVGSGGYAGSRTVLGSEYVGVGQLNLSDSLEYVPGVMVQRRGDVLSPTGLSIRGGRAGQVLVLLDGEPMNEERPSRGSLGGWGEGVDLGLIPPQWVESLEVVRGASSGLGGAGAATGLIRVTTRPPLESGWGGRGTLGNGGSGAGQVYGSGDLGEQQWAFLLNHRYSQGNYIYYDALHTAGEQGHTCARRLTGDFYERRCQERRLTHLRLDWRANSQLRQQLDWSDERQRGLGGVADARPHGLRRIRRWKVRQQGNTGLVNWNFSGGGLKGMNDENIHLNNALNKSLWRNAHARLRFNRWWGKETAGILLEGGASQQRLRDAHLDVRRRKQFARLHAQQLSERGSWEFSGQHDSFEDLEMQYPQQLQTNGWRTAASIRLPRYWGVKFSLGQAHRPPALYERYAPSLPTNSPANPQLKPERSSSYDGGIFLELSPSLYTEWIAFQQEIHDNILSIANQDNPLFFRYENVHRVHSEGTESLLSLRLNRYYLDVSLTRLNARIRQNALDDPRFNGNFVPHQPQKQITWRLGTHSPHWQTELRSRQVSRRFLNRANTRFLEPYRIYHLRLGFQPKPSWQTSLNIRNLTNITYAESENHPPAGRQWLFTLAWQFPNPPVQHASPSRPITPAADSFKENNPDSQNNIP